MYHISQKLPSFHLKVQPSTTPSSLATEQSRRTRRHLAETMTFAKGEGEKAQGKLEVKCRMTSAART